jgi:hypothetical protein
VARAFLSQSGRGSGAGGCTHLGIQLTYERPDPTVVSYLLFTSAQTGHRKLALIYIG